MKEVTGQAASLTWRAAVTRAPYLANMMMMVNVMMMMKVMMMKVMMIIRPCGY